MVNIDYRVEGSCHRLTVTGHAGYAPHGNDIVCAGVSAITFTLLGFLDQLWDDMGSAGAQVGRGDVRILCQGGEKTALAFEMALTGFRQIAAKYPEHVALHTGPQQAAGTREQTAHDTGERPQKGA